MPRDVRRPGRWDDDRRAPRPRGLVESDRVIGGVVEYVDGVFWNRHLYDRWPLVVKLSDRITVEPYRQVPPISDLGEDAIGVSGIGTIAAGRVIPRDNEEEAFVAVSMYARWLRPHPSTKSRWGVWYPDASAHRIISDLSAFIGHTNPTTHRILAAGDLNMFYGAIGSRLSLPQRDRTVWDRMQALGLEFLGLQAPHGRRAETTPDDVPPDTKNVPTYYRRSGPATAVNQLDYAFASHARILDDQGMITIGVDRSVWLDARGEDVPGPLVGTVQRAWVHVPVLRPVEQCRPVLPVADAGLGQRAARPPAARAGVGSRRRGRGRRSRSCLAARWGGSTG